MQEYGIDVLVSDNVADEDEVLAQHGISLLEYDEVKNVDAVVLAVCHSEYKKISLDMLKDKYSDGMKVLVDVKSMYSQKMQRKKVICTGAYSTLGILPYKYFLVAV